MMWRVHAKMGGMVTRCARCQRFKASDGLLFCPSCAPPGAVRQDATVTPSTITVRVLFGDEATTPMRAQLPASFKVKASVRRGGRASRLVAKQDRGLWNRDR